MEGNDVGNSRNHLHGAPSIDHDDYDHGGYDFEGANCDNSGMPVRYADNILTDGDEGRYVLSFNFGA